MNIVVSDPKTRKAYTVKSEKPVYVNKRMGEKVDLKAIGLDGFEGKITGGSDKEGFPMHPSIPGTQRKKALLGKGIGFKPTRKGERRRVSVRGNTVSTDIQQLNVVVTAYGAKALSELTGGEAMEEKTKTSFKEQAVKESLENVGKIEADEKIKGKIKG
ncbi:MAG: 30S ribosomal protein S6e [Candidatus Diapherotrites archaeon]|nr:30S ribosomal protein S6e [Candidatus Diapherotrites archaeon]